MKDPQQFGREMAEMVRGYVARAVEPLRAENESLRAENKAMLDCLREIEARSSAVERRVTELFEQANENMAALHVKAQELRERLDELTAQEAPDLTAYAKAEDVAEVRAKIEALPEPIDHSKDIEDLRQAVEAIEIPEPIPGPAGRDGVGIAELKQNDDGELIVKMTTGETFNVGKVRGEDGMGFDDMTVEHDGERGFAFIFAKGDRLEREEFVLPVVIDRGTWKEGRTYQAGDGVTAGGSYWIAQTETSARPETSKDWRLAVKRGRDGKDGTFKMAPEGPVRLS